MKTSNRLWGAILLGSGWIALGGTGACSGGSSGGGNGDAGGSACTPGAQVSCACPGAGASGVQVCKTDGSGYDACECNGQDAAADTAADAPTSDVSASDSGSSAETGGETGADAGACDPVAQTGCGSGEKCSWVVLQNSPTPVGRIACVPSGSAAQGAACTQGAPGPTTGYDDCQKGLACTASGQPCETICDPAATTGSPGGCITGSACVSYDGTFTDPAADGGVGPIAAGFCEPTCDPVAQTCGTGKGCYGSPSQTSTETIFQCSPDPDPTLTSDAACTTANGCEGSPGSPYLNGCAAGYLPFIDAAWNNTQIICVALCQPGSTSQSSPSNASGLVGSGHTCPDEGAAAPQHECRFWWAFEGPSAPITAVSNGAGVCLDFANYKYDSNNDGMIDSSDANWPSCATLSSTAHNYDASVTDTQYWGCESVTTRPATYF